MKKYVADTKGFTLPEILITLVISGITAIAAGSIVVWITGLSSFLMEKNQAEQSLMLAAYRIKSTLALAINVGNNGIPGNTLCTTANLALQGGGCFVQGYSLASLALNGQVDTLARFYREGGSDKGQMVETAIFFRRPDITNTFDDGSYPSGALYFSTVTPDPTNGTMIPVGPDSIVYDRLTNLTVATLQVQDTILAPPGAVVNRAKSVSISLTSRYYIGGKPQQWLYCPLGTCNPLAPYKDQSLSVDANFIDNVIHVGSANNGDAHVLNTLFGNIYFLQTQLPSN